MGSAIEKQKTFEDDMRIEKDSFRLARNSSETESIQTSESSESTLSNPLLYLFFVFFFFFFGKETKIEIID